LEQESYARLKTKDNPNFKNVITLNVSKRAGENLIEASDKINDLIKQKQKTVFPKGLDIVVTGDQSDKTRTTLNDLINTIIIGFILVTVILMFFMGTTNAIFVALIGTAIMLYRLPGDAGYWVYAEHDRAVLVPAGIGYCGG
jgi:multidrug efflux pump